MTMAELPCSPEQWQRLPIALRRRWWSETNYGRKPPSKALWQEIKRAINGGADASPAGEDDDVI
jgi:hypothetical protein